WGCNTLSKVTFSLSRKRYAAIVSANPRQAAGMLSPGRSASRPKKLASRAFKRSSPKLAVCISSCAQFNIALHFYDHSKYLEKTELCRTMSAPRGNASRDALRHTQTADAERPWRHSHAER